MLEGFALLHGEVESEAVVEVILTQIKLLPGAEALEQQPVPCLETMPIHHISLTPLLEPEAFHFAEDKL